MLESLYPKLTPQARAGSWGPSVYLDPAIAGLSACDAELGGGFISSHSGAQAIVSWRTLGSEEYVRWFGESLGAQLLMWKQLRFLHDYHHPGASR